MSLRMENVFRLPRLLHHFSPIIIYNFLHVMLSVSVCVHHRASAHTKTCITRVIALCMWVWLWYESSSLGLNREHSVSAAKKKSRQEEGKIDKMRQREKKSWLLFPPFSSRLCKTGRVLLTVNENNCKFLSA